VYGRITRWWLLFLEYEFILIYKLNETNAIAYALSILLNSLKQLEVPY
jgi:hypothetical protein